MMGLWIALVWLTWVSVSPALAEIYRWTDDAGNIYFTNDPGTIPPAYRARARAFESGAPDADETPTVDAPPSAPQPPPAERTPAAQAPASSVSPTAPQIADLEQQIAEARQERQTYFEQLGDIRDVQATPPFVRQRRQIGELGYALLRVEQQIDTLEQDMQQLQARSTLPPEPSTVAFDRVGNSAMYWQERMAVARERVQQAQTERRDFLSQLGAIANAEQRVMGRQGHEILQLAQSLQEVEQVIDASEAALQAVQQEALQAGAPRAWLQ